MSSKSLGYNRYVTSTPKSDHQSSKHLIKMEQTREYGAESRLTRVSYQSSSSTNGPSSYQAMFGFRAKGLSRGSSARYGYAGEGSISAVTVNESFAQLPGILTSRSEEKQELSVLNDRFATYIDKVRRLEAQNKALSSRIVELESTKTVVSRSGDMFEDELARLRREIEKLTHDKANVEIQLHNCLQNLGGCEKKLKIEIEARIEADALVKSLRKDVDDATLARIDLERKLETLQEELQLLKATSAEDMEILKSQVTVKHAEEVFDGPTSSTDLTESLRDIRAAYEKLSASNSMDIESVYKVTIADLQVQVKNANQALTDSKASLLETRRQLQTVTVEIEGLRSTNASLEDQIAMLQDRGDEEVREYTLRISTLEADLQSARDQMARHLVEYNKLMNLKLSLDLEIATYRNLLEGEEGRISKSASYGHDQSGYSTVEKSVTDRSGRQPSMDSEKYGESQSYHEDDVINLMIDDNDVDMLQACKDEIAMPEATNSQAHEPCQQSNEDNTDRV